MNVYHKIKSLKKYFTPQEFANFEKDIFDLIRQFLVERESEEVAFRTFATKEKLIHQFYHKQTGKKASYHYVIKAGYTEYDVFEAKNDGTISHKYFNMSSIGDYINIVYRKIRIEKIIE